MGGVTRRESSPVSRAAAPSPGQTAGGPVTIWLALGSLYIIWGSTYLAIRVAIDTMPPLLMAAMRFLVAGGLLYAWSIWRGDREGDRPGRRQWIAALIIGGLLLLGGNGGVAIAEQTVASGLVALIIAMTPLWMALLDRIVYGQRLAAQAIAGLFLGFGGLIMLVGPPGEDRLDLSGVLVALGASLAWATGSIYARGASLPRRPLVANGMQMLGGGALLAVAGIAAGELGRLEPARFSAESILAVLYLIVFGSLIAFSAYMWLLRVAPISLVSTYAYVNPVVAVFLGWLFLDEAISARTAIAGGVIVLAVAMIITARRLPPGEPGGAGPDESLAPGRLGGGE
jgi:drug/metabolite transporter (DMT)-like permease